jgi:hypothetical protein
MQAVAAVKFSGQPENSTAALEKRLSMVCSLLAVQKGILIRRAGSVLGARPEQTETMAAAQSVRRRRYSDTPTRRHALPLPLFGGDMGAFFGDRTLHRQHQKGQNGADHREDKETVEIRER